MTPGTQRGRAAQSGAAHGSAGPGLHEDPGPDLGERPFRHHQRVQPAGEAAPVPDRVNVAE